MSVRSAGSWGSRAPVLPVAEALRALWGRRSASAAAGPPPRSARAGAGRDRAAGAQRGHQHGDLGLWADRGVPDPHLAVRVAPSTVQRVLRRAGLATRRARLTVLEQQAARTAGLLTERTRQRLWRARHGRTRHVEAREPGQFVCLVKADVGCPENTEVRCPLFTDVRVPRVMPRLPPPRARRPAWACARAGRPSSSPAAGSCRP